MSAVLEQGSRVQRAGRIILGTGLVLDQGDDGATILSVAAGVSSIGVQDVDTPATAATRLVFQGSVVAVDAATGIATFNLDGRYSQLGHNHSASEISGGTLADARLSTNIPRLNGANTFANLNYFERAGGASDAINIRVAGDASSRLSLRADGRVEWGGGASARDTYLYRSAAGVVKTDGTFDARDLTIGGTAVLTSGRVLQNVTADAGILNAGTLDPTRVPAISTNDFGADVTIGRAVDRPPSDYTTLLTSELKTRSALGMPGTSTYMGLLTIGVGTTTGPSQAQFGWAGQTLGFRSGAPSTGWGSWQTFAWQNARNTFTGTQEFTGVTSDGWIGSSGTRMFTGRTLARMAASSAVTGALVIHTGINGTTAMSLLRIVGYLYNTSDGDIDLNLRFYNAAAANTRVTHKGSARPQVRIAQDAAGKRIIILGDVSTVWTNPKIWVESAILSHSGSAPGQEEGWEIAVETDLSGYTGLFDATDVSPWTNASNLLSGTVPVARVASTSAETSYTRAFADDPGTYPTGVSSVMVRTTEGWPGLYKMLTVGPLAATNHGGALQLLIPSAAPAAGGQLMYRTGRSTTSGWSALKTLADTDWTEGRYAQGGGFIINQHLRTTDRPTFGGVYSTDWYRVTGNFGLYWETWGGGWQMTDATYIRAYGNKSVLVSAPVYATRFIDADDNGFYLDPAAASVLKDATLTGTLSLGTAVRQMLNLYGTTYALGVQSSTMYFRSGGGYAWFKDGVHHSSQNNPGAGGSLLARLDASGNLYATGDLKDQWTEAGTGTYLCHVIPRGTFSNTLSAPIGTLQVVF